MMTLIEELIPYAEELMERSGEKCPDVRKEIGAALGTMG